MDIVKPKDIVTKNIKMLIYGQSGSGKTKFATNVKDGGKTLLIDLEKGSASAYNKNIDSVIVNSAVEYKVVLEELQTDTKYDTIIVDSYTKYAEMLYDTLKTADPSRQNGQAVWGDYSFRITSNTLNLLSLKKNIIITALDDRVLFEDYKISFPLVAGQKFKISLPKEFDIVGYLTEDKHGNRILRTDKTNEHMGKDRFGLLPHSITSDYNDDMQVESNEMYGADGIIDFINKKFKGQHS